jgi:hypothetical protein
MSGASPRLPHTPSWRALGHYFIPEGISYSIFISTHYGCAANITTALSLPRSQELQILKQLTGFLYGI